MSPFEAVSMLPDQKLLDAVGDIVKRSNETTAELLVHLGEVEARELHLRLACSSMFVYCTKLLGFEPDQAYNRIYVARLARRLPATLEMLAAGQVSLSGLRTLAPHLDDNTHEQILNAARGKSKREIEKLVATLDPKPDAPDRIRKRPAPRNTGRTTNSPRQIRLDQLPRPKTSEAEGGAGSGRSEPTRSGDSSGDGSTQSHEPGTDGGHGCSEPAGTGEPSDAASPDSPPSGATTAPPKASGGDTRVPKPKPLSADRFKVEFTASAELVDLLERVQALMGYRDSGRRLEDVFKQALKLLEKKLLKERFGAGARPRRQSRARTSGPGKRTRTRHVPHAVRREVFERDGLQCAYVDPETGGRCTEQRVEFQHHDPYGRGGEHSANNVALFCRAHNLHAARKDYGREHIDAAIDSRRHNAADGQRAPTVRDNA